VPAAKVAACEAHGDGGRQHEEAGRDREELVGDGLSVAEERQGCARAALSGVDEEDALASGAETSLGEALVQEKTRASGSSGSCGRRARAAEVGGPARKKEKRMDFSAKRPAAGGGKEDGQGGS
jgi:hypothetical protein